jgi:plasmid maintenance system antidote protein VapI
VVAADIDVSPSCISGLSNGNRPITADTELRLGLFFNMAPQFWKNGCSRLSAVFHPSSNNGWFRRQSGIPRL